MKKKEPVKFNSVVEILNDAIVREVESFSYYTDSAKQTEDPRIKKLFLQLAQIEEGHKIQLEGKLKDVLAQIEIDQAMTGEEL
jgi:rubrerythrin